VVPRVAASPLMPSHSEARVIVVTSGKGGVGKTNITVNLALALSKRGKKTILLDADLGMANVDVILGVSPKAHLAAGHDLQAVIDLQEDPGRDLVAGQ